MEKNELLAVEIYSLVIIKWEEAQNKWINLLKFKRENNVNEKKL